MTIDTQDGFAAAMSDEDIEARDKRHQAIFTEKADRRAWAAIRKALPVGIQLHLDVVRQNRGRGN